MIKVFRNADGLWEGYKIEDVARPQAWQRNILFFYVLDPQKIEVSHYENLEFIQEKITDGMRKPVKKLGAEWNIKRTIKLVR